MEEKGKYIEFQRMLKGLSKLILSTFLVFMFLSCVSPLDVDTPRETIKNCGGVPFKVDITEIYFQENWNNRKIVVKFDSAMIDTSCTDPRLWLDLELEFEELETPDYKKLKAKDLMITTTDLKMKQNPYSFIKTPIEPNEATLKIERGINIDDEVEISADNKINISEISFNVDYANKEIWSKFNSKIFNNVIEQKERDSTIIFYIEETEINPIYDIDNTIIGWDTVTVNNKYTKDSTIIYFDETPDTLFLRGTIVFEW